MRGRQSEYKLQIHLPAHGYQSGKGLLSGIDKVTKSINGKPNLPGPYYKDLWLIP
jgi:hypothetical protein